ncbi:hypothetical protein [Saccharopolyspora taberi]|uniref:Uncharacterized protein n=1 Tax=Saccharopolyspora taberi TaxID=60895 RepID=A0ABN3VPG0_9PSEU
MSATDQAAWARQMEKHEEAIRTVWAEDGIRHLAPVPGVGLQPPGPGREQPRPGHPVTGLFDNIPDSAMNEWHRIDKRLHELFSTEFLSGDLEPTRRLLETLGRAPLGSVRSGTGLSQASLEQKQVELDTSAQENLRKLDVDLQEWEGDAAGNFKKHLIDLELAIGACQDRIAAMYRAVAHYERALKAFRKDVLKAVNGTYAQFEEAEELQKKVALTVLGSVVATGAALVAVPVASGALASVAAWSAVGSALTSGGIGVTNLTMGGASKGEAVENMVKIGDQLVEDAQEAAGRVGEALYRVTVLSTGKNLNEVRPQRPKIVTDEKFDPDEFRHEDQPDEVTDRTSTDDLVQEPKKDADPDRDHHVRRPRDFWDNLRDPFGTERQPDAYEEQGR